MKNVNIQMIFESLPDLYLILDPKLNIVAASDAYLRATMVSREEIIGHYAFDIFPENPNDLTSNSFNNAMSSFQRVLKNKTADILGTLKYDIRRPESKGRTFEERFWSVVNTPLVADNKVTYIIHRVEDVTQMKTHETTILKQKKAIQELLLPILQLRDGLLLLPIIGYIDELRAMQLTEQLLHTIRNKRARVILIDVTGVPTIDERVANLLLKTVEATRLMGAKLIITGFSTDVAETLVRMNIDFSKITITGDLQSGMELANNLVSIFDTYL